MLSSIREYFSDKVPPSLEQELQGLSTTKPTAHKKRRIEDSVELTRKRFARDNQTPINRDVFNLKELRIQSSSTREDFFDTVLPLSQELQDLNVTKPKSDTRKRAENSVELARKRFGLPKGNPMQRFSGSDSESEEIESCSRESWKEYLFAQKNSLLHVLQKFDGKPHKKPKQV